MNRLTEDYMELKGEVRMNPRIKEQTDDPLPFTIVTTVISGHNEQFVFSSAIFW